MGSLGAPELIVILLVALVVLGPNRLPDAARQMGKALGELRRMADSAKAEMRSAMDVGPGATPAASSTPAASVNGQASGATTSAPAVIPPTEPSG